MLKSSDVTLIGFEKISSGHCTVIVRRIASVRIAVDTGAQTAKKSLVSWLHVGTSATATQPGSGVLNW